MINKGIYFVLSVANLAAFLYFAGEDFYKEGLIFYAGILLNHLFLALGVSGMLKAQKKSFLLIIKFFVLGAAFVFAMKTMPDLAGLCVLTYIFQLIILALSIKRDSKKN